MSKKPNFLIPGVGKGGTHTIRSYLREHPDVFFCRAKEPNFFTENYDLGDDWYMGLFSGADREKILGEATTDYMYWPTAPERMRRFNPGFRFVFSLRRPSSMCYSQYTARLSRNGETWSFREFLDGVPRIREYGKYHTNICRYLEHFDMSQMYFLVFEEFVADPHTHLKKICEFLDIDPGFAFSSGVKRENPSQMPISTSLQRFRMRFFSNIRDNPVKFVAKGAIRKGIDRLNHIVQTRPLPAMDPEDRAYLDDFFEEEVEGLEKLTGLDLSHWREPVPAR